jgi:hypothetical protein
MDTMPITKDGMIKRRRELYEVIRSSFPAETEELYLIAKALDGDEAAPNEYAKLGAIESILHYLGKHGDGAYQRDMISDILKGGFGPDVDRKEAALKGAITVHTRSIPKLISEGDGENPFIRINPNYVYKRRAAKTK